MPKRLLFVAALAHAATAQSLVLPDSANSGSTGTSAALWRTTPGTVQLVYDTTHFTRAGVTGPISIDRLRFRGHDAVVNPGGQLYTGATVRLGYAAVDHAAMAAAYATNRGTMGPAGTTNLTLLPLTGTTPNDTLVDIDLGTTSPAATFTYDPTLGQDLLIELTLPSAPVPTTLLASPAQMNGALATNRARMNSGSLAGPGAVSDAGAVVTIDFLGPGGYFDAHGARIENLGAACGGEAQSFYQIWEQVGDVYDLRNDGAMLMTPDNPGSPTTYFVSDTLALPDLSATALAGGPVSTANDAVLQHTPGFTFRFPGGATTTLGVCTNGYIWLGGNTLADPSPTRAEFLGSQARLAPCWFDHHCGANTATHPASGLYVRTDTSGGVGNRRTYVTWLEVGQTNGAAWSGYVVDTFQCIVHENGNVEFRYGAMNGLQSGTPITGFSRGGTSGAPCVDPGSRDLSYEHYFPTRPEGSRNGMVLSASLPPLLSTIAPVPVSHTLTNIPAGTTFAALLVSFAAFQPGVQLFAGPQGCLQSIQGPMNVQMVINPPNPWTTIAIQMPMALSPSGGGWFDLPLVLQGAALTVAPKGALSTLTTNALRLHLGLQ